MVPEIGGGGGVEGDLGYSGSEVEGGWSVTGSEWERRRSRSEVWRSWYGYDTLSLRLLVQV
jgi:hypothetical protein